MSTYGIDLGTTYSCIATLDRNGNPEIIKNQADASDTLASAAFFESADNVVIGNAAKDMIETDGERVRLVNRMHVLMSLMVRAIRQ